MDLQKKVKNFMGNNSIRDNRDIISDLRKDSWGNLFQGDLSGFIDNRREMWDLDKQNIREIGKHDPRVLQPYLDYKKSTSLPARLVGKAFKGDENYFKTDAQLKSEESGLDKMLEDRRLNKAIDKDIERAARAQGGKPLVNIPDINLNLGFPQPSNGNQEANMKVGFAGKGDFYREKNRADYELKNSLTPNQSVNLEGHGLEKLVAEQAAKDHSSIYGMPNETANRYIIGYSPDGNNKGPTGGPGGGGGGDEDRPPKYTDNPESLYQLFSRKMYEDQLGLRRSMSDGKGDETPEQLLAIGMLNDRHSRSFARQAGKAEKNLKKTFNSRLEDLIIDDQLRSTADNLEKSKRNTYQILEDGLTSNIANQFYYKNPDSLQEVDATAKLLAAMNGASPGVYLDQRTVSEGGDKSAGLISDIGAKLDHATFGGRNININDLPTPKTRYEHDKLNSYLRGRANDLIYMNLENPTPRMKATQTLERPDTSYMTDRLNKPIDSEVMKRYYATKYPGILGGEE